jgi:hypothetical protein
MDNVIAAIIATPVRVSTDRSFAMGATLLASIAILPLSRAI